jgi:outer membrane protein OmpA-like peptidoglycan-associated protein
MKPHRLEVRQLLWAAVAGTVFLAVGTAHADVVTTSLPVERWQPAVDDSGFAMTEGAGIAGHLHATGGLFLDFESNPLVLRDSSRHVVKAIVADRLTGNAVAGLGLFDFFSLNVDVPVVVFQGDDGRAFPAGVTPTPLSSFGLGDVRLVPKVRILREDKHGVSLAVVGSFTVPTSVGLDAQTHNVVTGGGYLGESPSPLTFTPAVVLSTNLGGVRLAGDVSWHQRVDTAFLGVSLPGELGWHAGVGYDVARAWSSGGLLVFLEGMGATSVDDPFGLLKRAGADPKAIASLAAEKALQNSLEVLGGARFTFLPHTSLDASAGLGVLGGFGTPDWRVNLGVRTDLDFSPPPVAPPPPPPPDADGDGVPDVDDTCPNDLGFADLHGCPDSDGDGIADSEDACPMVAGPRSAHGCPDDADHDGIANDVDKCPTEFGSLTAAGCPDADGDGIPDASDACPNVAGIARFDGCKDTDGDGIPDPQDKCPEEAEVINGVDDDDGCPDEGEALVVLTSTHVEILQSVYFDTNRDTIQDKSHALLDQLAHLLVLHPDVHKVRIEGHTDNVGNADANLDLSKRRAKAVHAYLVRKGVLDVRLDDDGFGASKPIADNVTEAGRAKNRRVEFVIVPDVVVAPARSVPPAASPAMTDVKK